LAAAMNYEYDTTSPMVDHYTETLNYAGMATALEFRSFAVYALGKHWDVILDAGYEYAKINSVKATKDAYPGGPFSTKAGDVYPRDWSGNPVPWNLSGLGGHLGLRYLF